MSLSRKPMKRSQPRRSWAQAREKVEKEGCCRVCGESEPLEAAHLIGRHADPELYGPRGGVIRFVLPESIVPLCGSTPERRGCHQTYDERKLDLLPYLSIEEQCEATRAAGGIALAYKRLTSGDQT